MTFQLDLGWLVEIGLEDGFVKDQEAFQDLKVLLVSGSLFDLAMKWKRPSSELLTKASSTHA